MPVTPSRAENGPARWGMLITTATLIALGCIAAVVLRREKPEPPVVQNPPTVAPKTPAPPDPGPERGPAPGEAGTVAEVEALARSSRRNRPRSSAFPSRRLSASGLALVLIPPVPWGDSLGTVSRFWVTDGESHFELSDTVRVPFLMSKYEVTQGEWTKVMGYNPSHFRAGHEKVAGQDPQRFPVEMVNWFDCFEFCNKLSEREGLPLYYELAVNSREGPSIQDAEVKTLGGRGYYLPTDDQWTWACAAGGKGKYHFDSDDSKLGEYAWYGENSGKRTHRVGELKPNAFGLFDTLGNVREWNVGTIGGFDPVHINRGGCWAYGTLGCTVTHKNRTPKPTVRHSNVGFRPARDP